VTDLRFFDGERAAINAEFDRLEELARGLERPFEMAKMMHIHHCAAIATLRTALDRRPQHADIAPLLLSWARSAGAMHLYAQRIAVVYFRLQETSLDAFGFDLRALDGSFIAHALATLRER